MTTFQEAVKKSVRLAREGKLEANDATYHIAEVVRQELGLVDIDSALDEVHLRSPAEIDEVEAIIEDEGVTLSERRDQNLTAARGIVTEMIRTVAEMKEQLEEIQGYDDIKAVKGGLQSVTTDRVRLIDLTAGVDGLAG